ncbi:hypothetical protein [Pigmentiphaga sp.]|uniref:hypothetical protein n=1 Tax=Pigmentiphaga sp. TaxID=1977564 RepID=UPI00128B6C2D|nr:hypothetical protein [Pigmentiphaga sp.]MPS25766.1 hypothetical protein [Alcaligenaceae bacterium SAGV5]MPS54416.1 hypothetical protein [Alcaligenaceae bacterium SAGV3]MPT58556.1 hypothetical protein [Alcaligenaceae bacterium]
MRTHAIALPRDTTRQSRGLLIGNVSRLLHRVSGVVIILFVLAHTLVQAVRHFPPLMFLNAAWLGPLQQQPWLHGVLYFSLVFHTLYGLRLLVGDLGVRIDYRLSLWGIVGLSLLPLLREWGRYAGF